MKLTIERLGHLGDAIAQGPDGPVFVNMAMPGEEIEGDVIDGKIAAPRILVPSDDRVKAPCRHYKSCGGCSLQHASEPFVAEWKKSIVASALTAQGLEFTLTDIETSPVESRRRATFSGKRTKKGALIGFHARASDTIIDVPDCTLVTPELKAAMPILEKLCVTFGSRKGELSLSVTSSLSGLDVAVKGGKPLDGQLRIDLAVFAGQAGLARLAWDGEAVATNSAPAQAFGVAHVTPPAGAFLQATEHGENILVSHVLETVSGAKRVVDLFAGCGTFSLPIAENSEVHAVEGVSDMMTALDTGWRRAQGLKRVTTETRDLFRRPLLEDEFKGFDAVVIDPPRAGAEAQMRILAEAGVPIISAVSCNPVTFARDAKILVDAGYVMGPVTVVDQFRWSPHTEVVAGFSRAKK